MLTVIGFVCFLAATAWFAIGKAWPMALVSAGLALVTLDAAGPIRIG
jgi:hypothetical protein